MSFSCSLVSSLSSYVVALAQSSLAHVHTFPTYSIRILCTRQVSFFELLIFQYFSRAGFVYLPTALFVSCMALVVLMCDTSNLRAVVRVGIAT